MLPRAALLAAAAAALAVAVAGFRWGTYAAGGSDSSCYALMADAFASATLQPVSALASAVPWPDAPHTFAPGGFVPSEVDPSKSAPVCAPGFSVLLAPLVAIGGSDALFLLTPLAGALLVLAAFASARTMAGPVAGVMAAALVAASPALLYQVVQPMNDVTTAALWTATFWALVTRRWALAGVGCGLALLVRPNLLPLAVVALIFVAVSRSSRAEPPDGTAIARTLRFALGVLPFALGVLWLNDALYGSPFRTGYGRLGHLFGLSALAVNAPRYAGWLVETHTPFPLLACAAPVLVAREKRREAILGLAMICATCLVYFLYTPFDHWSYLRFLLPAISLMSVLSSCVLLAALERMFRRGVEPADQSGRNARLAAIVLTAAIAVFCVRTAADRLTFDMWHLEQRYRSAGVIVREELPPDAVVLSTWDSGAVRFHGRKEALVWAALDPAWLDRAVAWLHERGRTPYLLLESWEEPEFRNRFSGQSDIGKLDWPPRYEIDRVVRIYDPRDRVRYDRGEHIETEYVWPLRER